MTYCPIYDGYHGGPCEEMLMHKISGLAKTAFCLGSLVGVAIGFFLGRYA